MRGIGAGLAHGGYVGGSVYAQQVGVFDGARRNEQRAVGLLDARLGDEAPHARELDGEHEAIWAQGVLGG